MLILLAACQPQATTGPSAEPSGSATVSVTDTPNPGPSATIAVVVASPRPSNIRLTPDPPVSGEPVDIAVVGLLPGDFVDVTVSAIERSAAPITTRTTADASGTAHVVLTLTGSGTWQVDARRVPGNFRAGDATFALVAPAQRSVAPTGIAAPPAAAAIRFVVGPGVSAADEATVRAAVAATVTYLRTAFGSSRDDAVISVLASKTVDSRPANVVGCCTGLSGGSVYLDVDDPEWPQATTDKMKVVAHEYSHTFQDGLGGTFGCVGRETDNPKRTPVWFYEGWAEYLAYQVALKNGWYTQAAVATVIARAKADATASSLRMISVPPLRGARGLYTLGYVAADRLTSINGPGGIRDFCIAVGRGNPWQSEFTRAFGLNPDTFQDTFNAYVLALPN